METQKGSPFMLPVAIILAGALVGAGFYLSNRQTDSKIFNNDDSVVRGINIRAVSEDDHILGNPNAPVVIVEYSDTECPFCKTFHNTMHRLIDEYGKDGKLAWVYRHFPIDSLHSKARKEAEATECAAELGGLDLSELPKIADEVGIKVSDFESCLSSGKYANKIQEDFQDAVLAGAGGTPYSILVTRSGERIAIEGGQPYDVMKTIIDAALLNQGIQ